MPDPIDLLVVSPHLDDAAFSCGGALHAAARAGRRTMVVNVCAGPPPTRTLSPAAAAHHAKWGAPNGDPAAMVAARRAEDVVALGRLRAAGIYLDVPDAIYRRGRSGSDWLYEGSRGMFGALHADDRAIVERVARRLAEIVGVTRRTRVLAPLAVGHHVDHVLARRAAERWSPHELWLYEDYPYAEDDAALAEALGFGRWIWSRHLLTTADEAAKLDAFAAYRSQRGTFWPTDAAMRAAVRRFGRRRGGGRAAERVWRQPAGMP